MSEDRTITNLMEAFAGESQANKKYLAYAKKAEEEGKMNAAKLFRVAADAEAIHALKEFEAAGKIGSTADNLRDAIAGETYEISVSSFTQEAEAAGNKAARKVFTYVESGRGPGLQEALEALDQTEEVFIISARSVEISKNPSLKSALFVGCPARSLLNIELLSGTPIWQKIKRLINKHCTYI